MQHSISLNSPICYELKILGQPDASWLSWFGEATARTEVLADNSRMTTFSGVVMDQAAMVGLIRRLHGLGVVLVSVSGLAPAGPAASRGAVPER